MSKSTKTGNTEVGESVWSKETADTLRWAMNGKKNEWVLSTVDTETLAVRMWRSIPHWIYTRDGMGYKRRKKKLFVLDHKT